MCYCFFCPNGLSVESVLPIVAVYLTTVLISVSPAGEWVLAVLADAQEIKRKDIKIRLITPFRFFRYVATIQPPMGCLTA